MARLGPPLSQQQRAPFPLQLVVAVLDALLRCHRCTSALQRARRPLPLPLRLGGASPGDSPAPPPLSAYHPRPFFPSACSLGEWGAGPPAPPLTQHHTQRQAHPLPASPRQGWGGMAAPAKCHPPSSKWRKGAAMQSPPCSSVGLSSPWARGRGCGNCTGRGFFFFSFFRGARTGPALSTRAAFTPTAHSYPSLALFTFTVYTRLSLVIYINSENDKKAMGCQYGSKELAEAHGGPSHCQGLTALAQGGTAAPSPGYHKKSAAPRPPSRRLTALKLTGHSAPTKKPKKKP